MKKILRFIMVLSVSLTVYAGSSCKTDVWGNYVCTHDDGYETKTKTDVWGNDVATDNRGNTQKCKTDVWGNYVCD